MAVSLAFGYVHVQIPGETVKDFKFAQKGIIQFCGKDTSTVKEGLGDLTLVRVCCLKRFLLDG